MSEIPKTNIYLYLFCFSGFRRTDLAKTQALHFQLNLDPVLFSILQPKLLLDPSVSASACSLMECHFPPLTLPAPIFTLASHMPGVTVI